MQRVGGEQHAGHAKLGHQPRHRCDLVRRTGQLLVSQDQGSVTGKGAEHMNRLTIGQVVEVRRTSRFDAAAQRLAIERDRAQRFRRAARAQVVGVAAERSFEIVTAERQEQMAQRVDRWSTPEAGCKDAVQALALKGDEGDDLLVGGRARKRGQDRQQQQMSHAVALPLCTPRVGHFGECGKQDSKWHQDDLHTEGKSPPYNRCLTSPPLIPIRLSADLIDGMDDPGIAGQGSEASGLVT